MEPAERRVEIPLAEDNPADAKLLQEGLHDVPSPYHLSIGGDGDAALAFLERHAPYTEAPIPDLILLDIGLPTRSGWDVLAWLRATPSLTSIAVVMLTGILSPSDEEPRDQLQPTLCLTKPTEVEEYQCVR